MEAFKVERFLGNWTIDNERITSGLTTAFKEVNISRNENQLIVENVSDENINREPSIQKYDLTGQTTTRKIENELENSTFTYTLELKSADKLKINSNRLMIEDGGGKKLSIQKDEILTLMDDGKTLEVEHILGKPTAEIDIDDPAKESVKFTLYYKKNNH